MALLFIDGFDHYATADFTKKWTTTNGTVAVSAGNGRRGGASFRSTTSSAYIQKTLPASYATLIVGMSVKLTSLPVGSHHILIGLFDAGTAQCDVRVAVDGTLYVTRNGTTLTNASASGNVLSSGVTYYIEFKVTIADSISAGSCKVRVNGVDAVVVNTSQDTKNTSNASANQVRIGQANGSASANTVDIDDFYICDTSGSTNNDFLGDVRVDTIFPSADGNYSQFTPSTGTDHYALVDEATPNTTDYNDGSAVGDRDSYATGNLDALTSQTVYGLQVNAAVLKDDAGAKSAATFVRSSGTNGDGASTPLGTSQVYVSQVFETDPNGSIAWTETTVNAMEAGVLVTA